MKKATTYLIVAALALLPLSASATITRSQAVTLLANYDVADDAAYTYGFFRGPDNANADPLGDGVKSPLKVKTTSGAQVTVEAFTALSAPLVGLVAGDLLIFPNAPTVINAGASAVNVQGLTQRQERVIVTATDDNNNDVNTAIDLSQDTTGYRFNWKKFKTGTGTEDGKLNVSSYSGFQIVEQVTAIASDSIDFSLECRLHGTPNSSWAIIEQYSFTAVGVHSVYVAIPWDECRLGIKTTNDSAEADTAWAYIIGEKFDGR